MMLGCCVSPVSLTVNSRSVYQTATLIIQALFCIIIGTTNNLITGEIVDISSPNRAILTCTFLSGFTGSARCRVQYGTDPTYMNLPYSAETDEAGTAGESVSVVLREQLNSSSVYYYTVLALAAGVTVIVQGTFTTPKYSKLLIVVLTCL